MIEEYELQSDSSNEDDLEPNIPIVNKHNPYIKGTNLTDYGVKYISSVSTPVKYKYNEIPVYISNHNYNLSQQLEDDANYVKCLTLVDFISNISYTIYGFYYPILLCIISCCGYTGATTFNTKKIYCYLIYSYFQLLCKLYIFSYLIALDVSAKFKEKEQNKFPNYLFLNHLKGPIITASILLFIQILITKNVRNFHKKIIQARPNHYIVL